MENLQEHIIVSFTSYPQRIKFVSKVLKSIVNQTLQADKILLWLSIEQFPLREENLPKEILMYRKEGLEIRWCDDLKPHKKYFYTMQEYPESIIITIDDDIYYEKDMIETLVKSYKKYPYAISALRVHRIITNKFGEIMPYSNWIKEDDTALDRPAFNLIATGCGGVLYPPRCLNEIAFNKLKIIKSCIEADDLWLKVMELLNNKPVVLARKHRKINVIEDSQDLALWKENVNFGKNDEQLKAILKEVPQVKSLINSNVFNYEFYNNKKISIIMPVFNAEQYLTDTLESILKQSYGNFELICINDGSTDSSLEILKFLI